MQLTADEIRMALVRGVFTNDDLNTITEAVRYARAQLSRDIKRELRTGATVKFTSSRNGVTYSGKVEKVKIKYVLVSTPQGRFNVPANMLEVV